LRRKDSISVASNRKALLFCLVDTINISVSPHFQVFKKIVKTGGPCLAISSSPKESGMSFIALCWILPLKQRKAVNHHDENNTNMFSHHSFIGISPDNTLMD